MEVVANINFVLHASIVEQLKQLMVLRSRDLEYVVTNNYIGIVRTSLYTHTTLVYIFGANTMKVKVVYMRVFMFLTLSHQNYYPNPLPIWLIFGMEIDDTLILHSFCP